MNFEFLPIDEPFGVPRATFIGSAGRSGMDAAGDGSAPLQREAALAAQLKALSLGPSGASTLLITLVFCGRLQSKAPVVVRCHAGVKGGWLQ